MPSSAPAGTRDALLDIAKGLAIVLVVVGHTLQGLSADFDDLQAFRFIYAFHMPLFAFLAGAASTHWLQRLGQGPLPARLQGSALRIGRSAQHLLLPFAVWTLIGWWRGPPDVPLDGYLLRVLRQPDVSLWFLPCIFWCALYVSVMVLVVKPLVGHLLAVLPVRLRDRIDAAWLQCAAFIALWLLLKRHFPTAYGFVFANEFHGGLFLFFALGGALFRTFSQARSQLARLAPYVVFALLVPYWYRTTATNLIAAADVPLWLQSRWIERNYALVVALSGTLLTVDVARRLAALPAAWLHVGFIYLGRASLAIYAVHFYFLGYRPAVLAPLALSVAFFAVLSRVPVVRTLLFGISAPAPAVAPTVRESTRAA